MKGLDLPDERGRVITRQFVFEGDQLQVNADASWGEIRVEILDERNQAIDSFGVEDCEPVTGDSVRHRVAWRKAGIGALADTTVKLRFHLTASRLYAFQFGA